MRIAVETRSPYRPSTKDPLEDLDVHDAVRSELSTSRPRDPQASSRPTFARAAGNSLQPANALEALHLDSIAAGAHTERAFEREAERRIGFIADRFGYGS